MPDAPPVVLTIAGYDPSSGAGITADVKTAAAHGCFAVTCITAVTVQTTMGVRRWETLAPELVSETLKELAADFSIAAVRIGMLGTGEVAGVVAEFLVNNRLPNVVLDPILRSSSGAALLDEAGVEVLRSRLLPLAEVVTPNIEEAAVLAGIAVADVAGMRSAGQIIQQLGARAAVVTGGHLAEPIDLLSYGGLELEFPGRKMDTNATHGTGCAFATALACRLAWGLGMTEAVGLAKQYVAEAMAAAYPLGRGRGPLNHLYGWK